MKQAAIIMALIAIAACNQHTDKNISVIPEAPGAETAKSKESITDSSQFTSIQWIEPIKNVGQINEGQKVEIAFRFKNTGDKPLVIQSVQPGCGCTVADYPKQPIAAGEEAEIKASFDSKGRPGANKKDIFVIANTKGGQNHVLHFDVEVVKAKG